MHEWGKRLRLRTCRGRRSALRWLVGRAAGITVSTGCDGSAGEGTRPRDNPWWCRVALLRMPVPMGVKRVAGVRESFEV